MTEPINLRHAARHIFEAALRSVDATAAVQRAVRLDGSRLTVVDTTVDLSAYGSRVYAIAFGKAAPAMAAALDEVLGHNLIAGVLSGPPAQRLPNASANVLASDRWQSFAGGHPLPNQESLNAARASFALLKCADQERALVLFLVSGGGSAMMEWPSDELITLADLRKANRLLVSCGASIAEINSVRRAISAVKGGRLSGRAPYARQISLIISDTNPGDEASVASGPTMNAPADAHDARAVVVNYELLANLPAPILEVINKHTPPAPVRLEECEPNVHYVLLDNRTALAAAAGAAQRYGLFTEMAFDLVETEIAEGCRLLLSRFDALRSRTTGSQQGVCLISGGEFLCPVHGNGVGGRNAETVLRCAIEIDEHDDLHFSQAKEFVVLSAGTDGIDGNSPAAGAITDETTIQRARSLSLDARRFLETSDAFSFFNKLGDAVVSGATGTNVRDVRILLAD